MIKPLLRIIPSYSGNVKMSCRMSEYIPKGSKVSAGNLKTDVYDAIVRAAVLDSASSSLSKKEIKCNLLGSTYDHDLKDFYTYYKDTFFSSGYDYNVDDIDIIDRTSPTQSQTNTDLQMGCKRISYLQEGYQYEFFAPIYIDDVNSLPDELVINVKFVSKTISIAKEIRVQLGYSTDNYLHQYLYRYLQNVGSEVCTMKSDNSTVTYKGIDLVRGGMTKVEDIAVASLYTSQHTSADFDCIIANGYERNSMCMAQILPLSFTFNLLSLMTDKEKVLLKSTSFTVSGHYEKNGNELPWNDFMTDYRNLSLKVKRMDSTSGLCKWTNGEVPNLMEYGFPSVDEANLIDCTFSSKISRMYSRWKLQQSDDTHPYIINTKYSFNRNQDSPYMYGEFPQKYPSLQGIATLQQDKNSYDYSLTFPIGTDNEYVDRFIETIGNYKSSIESYQFDWFNVVQDTSDFSSWKSEAEWSSVINDKAYHKGILYILSNIYNKMDMSKKEKIDKFSVVLVPKISTIDATTQENIKSAQMLVMFEDTDIADMNANANKTLISDVLTNDAAALHSTWMFTNEGIEIGTNNAVVDNGIMYERGYSSYMPDWTATGTDKNGQTYTYCILNNTDAKYVDLNELGIDIDEINDYYDGAKAITTLSSLKDSLYKMTYLDVLKTFPDVDLDWKIYKDSLSILYGNVSLLNADDTDTTYMKNGFEMLPLHVPSSFTDSYGKIPLPGDATYFATTYILQEFRTLDPDAPSPIPGTVAAYMPNGRVTLRKCGYMEDPDARDGLTAALNTYALQNPVTVDSSTSYMHYSWEVHTRDMWIDPIFRLSYGSSTSNFGKTSIAFIDNDDLASSYLQVKNPYNISTSYSSTIYVRSKFLKRNAVESLQDVDVSRLTLTYIASSPSYDIDNMTYVSTESKEITNEEKLLTTTYTLLDYIYDYVKKEVESGPRYKYMPVVYGNSHIYARDLYIKKKDQKFFGNKIPYAKRDLDNDVIWVHTYNLKAVLAKYGYDDVLLGDYRTFKTKFLNKDHLYWWYTELARDADREYPTAFGRTWQQYLHIRKKYLIYDGDGLSVKNVLIPLYAMRDDEENKRYASFKEFYKDIKYSYSAQTWYFESNPDFGEFELVFDCDMVRLDGTLYSILNLEGTDKFRDLYLYRIETDDEWDTKYGNSTTYKVKYANAIDGKFSEYDLAADTFMVPMFNKVWAQEREDTTVYVYYKLQNLYEVEVTGLQREERWWRYNSYDIDWMYQVVSSQLIWLSEPLTDSITDRYVKSRFEDAMDRLGKGTPGMNQLNRYLYKRYQSNSIITDTVEENEDDLGYGIPMFCTKKSDGINYGYYKIVYGYDNTTNSIRMIGKVNESDENTSVKKWNYVTNMKYIKYVNGVDITANPEYLASMVTRMLPFMRVNPMSVMPQMDCLSEIDTISVECSNMTALAINPIKKEELSEEDVPREKYLIQAPNTYIQKLKRYFSDIVPVMTPASSVTEWYKKFKKNEEKILDKGNLLSVGDCCIYEDTASLSSFHPYSIYEKSENEDVKKSYNNLATTTVEGVAMRDTHTPLEHKSYNCSTFTLTSTYLCYTYPKYVKEEVLATLEDEEHTIEVFKQLLGTNKEFSEDEILFLYNYYKVTYDTVPVKLSLDGTKKLWKLIYKFTLM